MQTNGKNLYKYVHNRYSNESKIKKNRLKTFMANVKKFVYVSTLEKWTENENQIIPESGKWFKSIVFRADNNTIYNRGKAYGLSTENAQRITDLETAKAALEAHLKSQTVSAAANKGIEVTVSGASDAFKTYTIGAIVDGKTVTVGESGIAATKTLEYVATSGNVAAHINLKNAAGEVESTIQVSDIIGNGVIDHTSYDKESNSLSLFFKQADGALKEEKVDMKELIDINDIFIGADSQNYLKVSNDASTATFDVKIKTMAETSYAPGSIVTGLVDSADVKKYIDSRSSDLGITAEGDDYIDASVDAAVDNKHVNISVDVQDISVVAGQAGAYNAEGAQTSAPVHGTLTGVDKSLVDGAQAATAIKSYVDGEVAIEAARADAKIVAAVKALDKASSKVDGTNVHVDYKEEDGIVTIEGITEDYATVNRTATSSTAETPASDASIAVTVGDEGKLVKASDLASVAGFAADKVTEEAHRVDKKIKDLSVEAAGDSYVKAEIDAANNKKVNVSAQVADLTLTSAEGVDSTLAGEAGKLVDASEAASKVSGFVNARIAEEVKKLHSDATSADGTNVTVKVTEVDGKLSAVNVTENYAEVVVTTVASGNASFTVKSGDENKLVKASDLKAAVDYIEDIYGWEEL